MNFAYCKTKYRHGFQMYMSPFCSSPIYIFTVEGLFFLKIFSLKRCKGWLLNKQKKKKAQSSCILRNWSQSCYKWKGLFESINKNKLYLRRVVSVSEYHEDLQEETEELSYYFV